MQRLHLGPGFLAVLLLSSGTAAVAGVQSMPLVEVRVDKEINMTGVDKNADRQISRDEARQHQGLASQFEALDSNRDGQLDQSEFAGFEAEEGSPAEKKRVRRERGSH